MAVLRRLTGKVSGVMRRCVIMARNCGVTFKVRLVLLVLVVLPLMALLVVEETSPDGLQLILAIALLVSIMGFLPLANLVTFVLVGRDLKEIADFCQSIKRGDYGRSFDLPNESDEEHQMVKLKRDLSWMAHVISHRESCLQSALEGAHRDKSLYETLSNLDSFTGLANRGYFEKCVLELAQETEYYKGSLTLLFIDCDNFKAVNDLYGHQTGDELLKRLAEIITANVREHVDLPFRYGGDEFGVVYVGMRPEQATMPAERIRNSFNRQSFNGTTLSMGISSYTSRGPGKVQEAIAAFIRAADQALYKAKAQGGDRILTAGQDT